MNGTLTSSMQVDKYLEAEADNNIKLFRLYLKERYSRDTSLSLPKNSAILGLMKDHKKLPLKTYSTHLKLYLDNIVSNAEVTTDDLNTVLHVTGHLDRQFVFLVITNYQ